MDRKLKQILVVLALAALTSLPIPVCGQIPLVVADWGDQYRHELGKPEYGWLEEGFRPVGASNGRVLFVKTDGWSDYNYYVSIEDIGKALDAGAWVDYPAVEEMVITYAARMGWCVARNAGDGQVMYGLSRWPDSNRSFERALELYDRAIISVPGNVDAWNGKGTALFFLGRYGEAVVAYEEALRLEPENPYALTSLGTAHRAIEDRVGADAVEIGINPLLAGLNGVG